MKAFLCLAVVLVSVSISSSIVIENVMYYSDAEALETYEAAQQYCIDQGGELAKIYNTNLYNQVLRSLPEDGAYWINGKDRSDAFRFETSQLCSWNKQPLDYFGLPASSLALDASVSCLSLNRGATAKASKLVSAPCTETKYPLCEFPVNGCDAQPQDPNMGMAGRK